MPAPGVRLPAPWGAAVAAGTVRGAMHARLIPNFPDVTVRPIGATNKDALLDLFTRMSDRSRARRFLSPKPRLSARELAYFTEVDHRTHEALVALTADGTFV